MARRYSVGRHGRSFLRRLGVAPGASPFSAQLIRPRGTAQPAARPGLADEVHGPAPRAAPRRSSRAEDQGQGEPIAPRGSASPPMSRGSSGRAKFPAVRGLASNGADSDATVRGPRGRTDPDQRGADEAHHLLAADRPARRRRARHGGRERLDPAPLSVRTSATLCKLIGPRLPSRKNCAPRRRLERGDGRAGGADEAWTRSMAAPATSPPRTSALEGLQEFRRVPVEHATTFA